MTWALHITYNTSESSKKLSSYTVRIRQTDDPATGCLRSDRTVYNGLHESRGAFSTFPELVDAIARSLEIPFAVRRVALAGNGEPEYRVVRPGSTGHGIVARAGNAMNPRLMDRRWLAPEMIDTTV